MSRKRLQTLGDVRRYLAGLLNRYEVGEIGERHLRAAASVSKMLSGVIKDSELEERVEKLEKHLNDRGTHGFKRAN